MVEDRDKRDADGTETGRFNGRVVGGKDAAEVSSAEVELFGKFFGLAIDVANKTADSHQEKEAHDTDDSDSTDGEFCKRAAGFFDDGGGFGTGRFRDLIEVGKIIHTSIIT